MSFQPRAGMSEGFSAERPRPPSVHARLLRRRRSEPDSSRPSGRWRSILHVSVSLFAIAVARLLLGYFGLKLLDPPDRGRTRCFDSKNEPLPCLVPHNGSLDEKKMAPSELRKGHRRSTWRVS